MKKIIFFMIVCFFLTKCDGHYLPSSPVKISISTDGRYVLSTHYGRYLILWDIEQRSKKIISKKANIYSPFFISESHHFLWQNATSKEVIVQSVNGEIIKSFNPGFSVYGQVMSQNLEHYIAVREGWSLHYLHKNKWNVIKPQFNNLTGASLLLQISLIKDYFLTTGHSEYNDDKFPLNAGFTTREINPNISKTVNDTLLDGVVLWTIDGKPIKKFPGNSSKPKATMSHDEKYIVAGDENGFLYRWDIQYGRRLEMDRTTSKNFHCESKECKAYLEEEAKKNTIIPDDFNAFGNYGCSTAAVKFISDHGDYITFFNNARYGVLFHVDSPRIQAFLDLGINPHPHTFSVFKSANVIDSAPKAGILVMGQTHMGHPDGNPTGIIVYQFDKEKKNLKRIWAPDGPGKHRQIKNPENELEY